MASDRPWRLIARLGDTSPPNGCSYFVWVDETTKEADMEVLLHDPEPPESWYVCRVTLEKFEEHDGRGPQLASSGYFDEFEKSSGTSARELARWLCSDDPVERAQGYKVMAECRGYGNYDEHPQTYYDRSEVEQMFAGYELNTVRPDVTWASSWRWFGGGHRPTKPPRKRRDFRPVFVGSAGSGFGGPLVFDSRDMTTVLRD